MTLTVKNVGSAPTDLSIILPSGDFDFDDTPCMSGLQPGQTCPIQVSFTPKIKGVRKSVLELTNIDTDLKVPLTGTGK